MAGIAMASRPAAIAMAMPISINVMPRARIGSFLLGGGAPRRFTAVDGDVVGAALRLVRTVRIDVVSLAGADERVVAAPGILVDLAHELGHQLLQAVWPVARLDVIEVDAVRDRLQVELRRFDLRLAELAEDVVADGARDEAEDDEHDHDLDERHAAGAACTRGGNWPLRLSGAAMLSPSRMASRASSMTLARMELLTMFLTMSSAVRSGTPEESSVASVLAKRASASMRTTSPKMGARSLVRSHQLRPFSVLM